MLLLLLVIGVMLGGEGRQAPTVEGLAGRVECRGFVITWVIELILGWMLYVGLVLTDLGLHVFLLLETLICLKWWTGSLLRT